jgi:hypothetical protein
MPNLQLRPEPDIKFYSIIELSGLRAWIEGPMMAVVFGYQPNSMSDEPGFLPMAGYIPGFYLASTTVLGPIRMRQLRVESDSCMDSVRSAHDALCGDMHALKTSTSNDPIADEELLKLPRSFPFPGPCCVHEAGTCPFLCTWSKVAGGGQMGEERNDNGMSCTLWPNKGANNLQQFLSEDVEAFPYRGRPSEENGLVSSIKQYQSTTGAVTRAVGSSKATGAARISLQ